MQTLNRIRVKALGLIRDDDRLFVAEGYQPDLQKHYYRALGGSIEFGETSLDALKREFQEEIQAELTNIQYLGCIENLFTYLGQPHHELIQFYQCDFADPRFYQLDQLTFMEDPNDGINESITARWIECDRFRRSDLWLVPDACLKFL